MFETIVKVFVYALTAYAGAGLVFALGFVLWGVQRLDSEAQGSGIGFRVLIVPGVAAFWPAHAPGSMDARNERAPVEGIPHR